MTDRYIWHETIQTQHTRRSFLAEVAPDALATVQSWLALDDFAVLGDYRCHILSRSNHCLEAEVVTGAGTRLVHLGVADHSRCAAALWLRLGGAPGVKPAEPWCVAWINPAGAVEDPEAYRWLGDFERCLAWAWLTLEERCL